MAASKKSVSKVHVEDNVERLLLQLKENEISILSCSISADEKWVYIDFQSVEDGTEFLDMVGNPFDPSKDSLYARMSWLYSEEYEHKLDWEYFVRPVDLSLSVEPSMPGSPPKKSRDEMADFTFILTMGIPISDLEIVTNHLSFYLSVAEEGPEE